MARQRTRRRWRQWRRWAFGLRGLVLLWLAAAPAFAEAAIVLTPGESFGDIAPHIGCLVDHSRTLTIAQAAMPDRQDDFKPLAGRHIDFGFTAARLWLRLDLINGSGRSGTWLLDLNVRSLTELDVWLVGAAMDPPRRLLHDDRTLAYGARQTLHNMLAVPFSLPAHGRAQLYIAYRSQGTTALPVSIATNEAFLAQRIDEGAKHAAFYAMLGLTIVYALLLLIFWRSGVVVAYIAFLLSAFLYMTHIDGYAFRYFWPGAPLWNNDASLPLGLLLSAAAANFARIFLATRTTAPTFDRLLRGLIGAAGLLILAALLVDTRLLKQIAFFHPILVAATALTAGIRAWRRRHPGARFFAMGWATIFACAIATAMVQWLPGLMENYQGFDFVRLGMIVDIIMMSSAIMDQIGGLQRDRDQAVRRVFQTQRHLTMMRGALSTAERLAIARGMKLASAGHDLRQPLFSLRAAMRQLVSHPLAERQTTDQLQRSLAYLEDIIDRYMNETLVDAAAESRKPEMIPAPTGDEAAGSEMFILADVLENLHFMFAGDAAAHGLDFRCVRSTMSADADALVVMRIVSNFIANAIRFTPKGKVLLGCRRRGAAIAIEVHDTGCGIAEADMARVFKAFERGQATEDRPQGWGLGLAIAAGLAHEHGYRLEAASRPGRGSVFRLIVPRA